MQRGEAVGRHHQLWVQLQCLAVVRFRRGYGAPRVVTSASLAVRLCCVVKVNVKCDV